MSGIRHNEGKLRWSLVDFKALEPMVRVLEYGCTSGQYDDFNWKNGLPTTEICESMLRHIIDYLSGRDLDEKSKLPIVGHILSNAMFLSYMYLYMPDMDTRQIHNVDVTETEHKHGIKKDITKKCMQCGREFKTTEVESGMYCCRACENGI